MWTFLNMFLLTNKQSFDKSGQRSLKVYLILSVHQYLTFKISFQTSIIICNQLSMCSQKYYCSNQAIKFLNDINCKSQKKKHAALQLIQSNCHIFQVITFR